MGFSRVALSLAIASQVLSMTKAHATRRDFLQATSVAAAGLTGAAGSTTPALGREPSASVETTVNPVRPRIACIGLRYQGSVIAHRAQEHGDIVAICDVDGNVRDQAKASFGSTPTTYEDYRDLLAAGGFEVVVIAAPDHWHAKMLIDACRAGKDVYCEKPLTLTIDEGKQIRRVVAETGRVVQVGSWQRSDERFRLAVEMVRHGRVGQLKTVDVGLGKNKTGGPFSITTPPPNLNWNLWQGQTPDVPYQHERCHYNFRWWNAYSGGQLTDWGAHHVDVAQWAIGEYPIEIQGTANQPDVADGYDVPTDFTLTYKYPSGVILTISDSGRNGVTFTGSEGRIFVGRQTLSGKPVEQLAASPLPREKFQLYAHDDLTRPGRSGKLDAIINHVSNFFDCVRTRNQPISDVESQHRSVTTCHLGNIALRLNRVLHWDPAAETFPNDPEACELLSRKQRGGFEVT